MERSPLAAVVLEQAGGAVFEQHLHAAGEASLGGEVQGGAALRVAHVQTHQRLRQHTQRLPVAVIRLARRETGRIVYTRVQTYPNAKASFNV